jgi:hypothetical protein
MEGRPRARKRDDTTLVCAVSEHVPLSNRPHLQFVNHKTLTDP